MKRYKENGTEGKGCMDSPFPHTVIASDIPDMFSPIRTAHVRLVSE